MNYAAEMLQKSVRRVLLTQAVLTLIAAAGFWLTPSGYQASPEGWLGGLAPEFVNMLSALYGGAVTLVGTWWLGMRVQRAGEMARDNPRAGQMALYAGSLTRFVGTLVLLGVAFGALGLAPIPLIAAFAIAQLGFVVNVGGGNPPPKH